MKGQAVNPFLPSWEYVPDGEPRVFGDRVYLYGRHDRFNGADFCLNDYVCWSAPLSVLSDKGIASLHSGKQCIKTPIFFSDCQNNAVSVFPPCLIKVYMPTHNTQRIADNPELFLFVGCIRKLFRK